MQSIAGNTDVPVDEGICIAVLEGYAFNYPNKHESGESRYFMEDVCSALFDREYGEGIFI